MRKCFLCLLSALLAVAASAQTTAEQYKARYDLLVSRLGVTGLGVETALDKWETAYPDDIDMLCGRFLYKLGKSARNEVVRKDRSRFLGKEPMLTLKDSLDRPVYYYEEAFYDDELFGQALKYIDRAVALAPGRLDIRLSRITALMAYEKESPDMTAGQLRGLIDYHFTTRPAWVYPGVEDINPEVFDAFIQEYCAAFFRYGVPETYAVFKDLSERMLSYEKDNPIFLDNLGSYYLVALRDNRTALKYYNKVLKKHPDDLTAIRNGIILARNAKDAKLEKKFLAMMVKYGPDETQRESARSRLESLK